MFSARFGLSLLAPRGTFALSWVGSRPWPPLLFGVGLMTAAASCSTQSSWSSESDLPGGCAHLERCTPRGLSLLDKRTSATFLTSEWGDSDLKYWPLFAMLLALLVGMAHLLVYNATVTEGFVERLSSGCVDLCTPSLVARLLSQTLELTFWPLTDRWVGLLGGNWVDFITTHTETLWTDLVACHLLPPAQFRCLYSCALTEGGGRKPKT